MCKIAQNVQNCAKYVNLCKISKNCAKLYKMWELVQNVQICSKCAILSKADQATGCVTEGS